MAQMNMCKGSLRLVVMINTVSYQPTMLFPF